MKPKDFQLKMLAKADELTDFGIFFTLAIQFICEKKMQKEFMKYLSKHDEEFSK